MKPILFAVALVTLPHGRADACDRLPVLGIDGFEVLPADGSTAAPNTRVWIAPDRYTYGTTDPRTLTLERGGVVVPTTITRITVGGEVVSTLSVLTPQTVFAAGDTIDAFATTGTDKRRISRFVIAGGPDHASPDVPEVGRIAVESAYSGAYSCGSPSEIAIDVGRASDLLFLQDPRAPEDKLPTAAIAVGAGSHAAAIALPAGAHTLTFTAMDLAGNQSARSAPIHVTIPDGESGCNAGSGHGGALALLGLLALRRRRYLPSGESSPAGKNAAQ